jgi:radical SAM superfamily enzyme YgiQ (UPF0313 family)
MSKNVLLVYPNLPRSFWSFQDILRATGRKALIPPLGLLTVAALLPEDWTPRLVDLNVRELTEADWAFADLVMISAMLVQRDGLLDCVAEARQRGKLVVAGGPYATSAAEEALAAGCDFVVAGEGEHALPLLAAAIEEGRPGGVIQGGPTTDMAETPLPRYDLIRHADYDAMPVQTSRGCPFACEFCDVINLFGRVPRYKPVDRILTELEAIYETGYRGSIFITDDNFIGNPKRAEALCQALIPWNKKRGEPYWYITQVSINLGERLDLIDLMTEANFGFVFIGIESPDTDVLEGAHKLQNTRHPLLDSIRTISDNGLSVIGSFILGFDRETKNAGQRIEAFVEAAGIPLVMVNTLQAVPGTKLWDRLSAEDRIVGGDVGDMATGVMNFRPDRPVNDILTEQLAAWDRLYEPSQYLKRTLRCMLAMRPTRSAMGHKSPQSGPKQASSNGNLADSLVQLRLLWRLVWRYGLASRHRLGFFQAVWTMWRKNPSRLVRFLTLLVMGDDILSFTRVIHDRAAPALAASREEAAESRQPIAVI